MSGPDTHPGTALPPQLVKYWTAGAGGQKIRWGVPGDFDRCRTLVNAEVTKGGDAPLSDRVISGLCASLHRLSTGATPGHAAGEMAAKH
jgi:hypothetical protein